MPDARQPIATSLNRSQLAYAGVLIALTLIYVVLISINAGRHLSFDELLTYNIAKAPTLDRLFYFLKKWDLNPPLVHLLAHYSMWILGDTTFALRLPSILAFYVASLALFAYISRKVGAAYASIAVLVLWYSPMFKYATEARPYALLSMFFCSLLLCWDLATTLQRRTLALCGIAISTVGLIGSHVFAPLSLLPFLPAEAIRWHHRRKPDYAVWAGLLLPMVGILAYIPLYESYKTLSFYPPKFQAGPRKMAGFYWHRANGAFVPMCSAFLAAILMRGEVSRSHPLKKIRPALFALFGVLVINPVLLNLVLMRDHAAFWPRYCITSALALYALFALTFAWIFRYKLKVAYAASLAIVAVLLAVRVGGPLYKLYLLPPSDRSAGVLAQVKPDLPIVAASGLTFVELGHYEQPALMSRIYYLRDQASAIEYAHATIFQDLDWVQKDFGLPGHVEAFDEFARQHGHFLVLGTPKYPEDWVLKRLEHEGARVALIGRYTFPYKDKNLYDVTLR